MNDPIDQPGPDRLPLPGPRVGGTGFQELLRQFPPPLPKDPPAVTAESLIAAAVAASAPVPAAAVAAPTVAAAAMAVAEEIPPPPEPKWVGEAVRDLVRPTRGKVLTLTTAAALAGGLYWWNTPPTRPTNAATHSTARDLAATKTPANSMHDEPPAKPRPQRPDVDPEPVMTNRGAGVYESRSDPAIEVPKLPEIPSTFTAPTAPTIPSTGLVVPSLPNPMLPSPTLPSPTLPSPTLPNPSMPSAPLVPASFADPIPTPPVSLPDPPKLPFEAPKLPDAPKLPLEAPKLPDAPKLPFEAPKLPDAPKLPLEAPKLPDVIGKIEQPSNPPTPALPGKTDPIPAPLIPGPTFDPKTSPEATPAPFRISPEPTPAAKFDVPTASKQPDLRPMTGTEPERTDFDVDLYEPKPGDTYETVSKQLYGDARYATALRAFNRNQDLGRGGAVQIPPMYVLRKNTGATASPPRPMAATSEPGRERLDWNAATTSSPRPLEPVGYTVPRAGMTLSDVANETLGDRRQWKKLWDLNTKLSPDAPLAVGTKVQLPAEGRK